MLPEFGHFALILALVLALAQFVVPLVGLRSRRDHLMGVAAPAALGQFVFLTAAFGLLAYAFYTSDFSVAYVAQNSNTALPWYYRLPAVWGGHEGSLLLWMEVLSVWTVAVVIYSRSLPRRVGACVIAIMGGVSASFLSYSIFTSDPFTRLFPALAQGVDLNPLLQDPGMISHPPMLYMGYVGFSVAFAFAITALITGRVDSAWTRWARPWTTAAWVFLTLGITLGSGWSYHVLGWGGWWFWDPVENASFMPWLIGTALIHSLAVTEKRGIFKSWTVLLAITAFGLSILGTFIVRSGVLTSVHAFATDPMRGSYILALFAVVIGSSLLLYTWRAPSLGKGDEPVKALSREGLLLLNNIFLVVAGAAVFLGTLYPLLAEAFNLGKVSVGPPYFNTVFLPLTLPLVVLVGFAATMAWKRTRAKTILKRLWLPLVLALIVGIVLPWVTLGTDGVIAAAACALALWAIFGSVQELWRRIRGRRVMWSYGVFGMSLAHIGLGVVVIGIALVSAFGVEKDVRLAPGQSATLSGYTYQFKGTNKERGPNYSATVATVVISRQGKVVGTVHPAKRHYDANGTLITRAGINISVFRDLYVSMGKPIDDSGWGFRLYYRPFVRWIWAGGIIMVLGGLFAALDPRYRRLRRRSDDTGKPAVSGDA